MSPTRIVVGIVIAVIVIAALDGVRSRGHTAATPTPPTIARPPGPPVGRCRGRDLAVAIDIRRRVAAVVVRNTGATRCLFSPAALDLRISDRAGRPVEAWADPRWFAGFYLPGGERTFSIPAVYRCDRPAPFAAFATVGAYSARRGNLSRSQITC